MAGIYEGTIPVSGSPSDTKCICQGPAGEVITLSSSNVVKFWDTATRAESAVHSQISVSISGDTINKVAYDPVEQYVWVFAQNYGYAKCYNLAGVEQRSFTTKYPTWLPNSDYSMRSAIFTPDGKLYITQYHNFREINKTDFSLVRSATGFSAINPSNSLGNYGSSYIYGHDGNTGNIYRVDLSSFSTSAAFIVPSNGYFLCAAVNALGEIFAARDTAAGPEVVERFNSSGVLQATIYRNDDGATSHSLSSYYNMAFSTTGKLVVGNSSPGAVLSVYGAGTPMAIANLTATSSLVNGAIKIEFSNRTNATKYGITVGSTPVKLISDGATFNSTLATRKGSPVLAKVTAFDAIDAVVEEKTIVLAAVPAPISGVQYKSKTSTTATLSWSRLNNSGSAITGIKVYRQDLTTPGTTSSTHTLMSLASGNEVTTTGLTAGHNYSFTIVAYNDLGESDASAVVTVQL